jgi:hypothetical protein
MAPGAVDRIFTAGFGKVLTTDSIPVAADTWLAVVPIALLLARTVHALRGENAVADG